MEYFTEVKTDVASYKRLKEDLSAPSEGKPDSVGIWWCGQKHFKHVPQLDFTWQPFCFPPADRFHPKRPSLLERCCWHVKAVTAVISAQTYQRMCRSAAFTTYRKWERGPQGQADRHISSFIQGSGKIWRWRQKLRTQFGPFDVFRTIICLLIDTFSNL